MNCKNYATCKNEARDNYEYCYPCYVAWKKAQLVTIEPTPSKQWHSDPTIDVLMKMNANLGRIEQRLGDLNKTLEELNANTRLLVDK